MRANAVYSAALANVSQEIGDNDKWDRMAIHWLNTAMAESLNAANALRLYYFRPPFEYAPRIKSLEDILPYHDRLYAALVELVTAQLWTDQDESYKAQDCRNRAQAELEDCLRLRPEKVRDVY